MKWSLLCLLAASTLVFGQASNNSTSVPQDLSTLNGQHEPPMLGIRWARGFNPFARANEAQNGAQRGTSSPLELYHGGKIMPTVVSKAIFWGPSWSNSGFVGDKVTGLDAWYTGFNASNYAATSNEWTGTNGQVGSTGLIHQGDVIDTSAAANGSKSSAILAEVCRQISAGNISPDPGGNGYYPVYVDLKRGHAGFCAYHSFGSCGGQLVQFAFFFNLDGDSGCDPQDTQTGHSQGLAALANVSGHELSEARSDPASPGAWYDSSGQENGDKCAWTFNVPFVTFSDGNVWKIQGEWSNNAFNTNTGYPNRSGQKGCLDGH